MYQEHKDGIISAIRAQKHSTDPSTQIGVAIYRNGTFVQGGCNVFPDGIAESDERWERPLKYQYVEHAERNAIYRAAKRGNRIDDGTLYMVGMGPPTCPCVECARAIIQSGIAKVVAYGYKPLPGRWDDSVVNGGALLEEAGVEFIELVGDEWDSLYEWRQ